MRKARALLALSLVAGVAAPAFAAGAGAAARKHRSRSASRSFTKKAASRFEPHQRSIDDARATEIQAALVKVGYLAGEPSGHWDQASIAAMTKLQADNGWQTKLVPDSRALIKLGLGPASPSADAQTTASLGASRTLASAQ